MVYKVVMNKIMLDGYQDRFVDLIERYMEDHNINQCELAKIVDLAYTRISNLRMKGADGIYRRRLSANYLIKFIQKGIVMSKDFTGYDTSGKEPTLREREFWEVAKVIENTELQQKITKALNGSLSEHSLIAFLEAHSESKK